MTRRCPGAGSHCGRRWWATGLSALLSGLLAVACTDSDDGPPALAQGGSVVVWVKGDDPQGGALWAKSLEGDLATSPARELFPQSTALRRTPFLAPRDSDETLALFWVEANSTESVIHRYAIGLWGPGVDEIHVSDGAFAYNPVAASWDRLFYSSNANDGDVEVYEMSAQGIPVRITNRVGNDTVSDFMAPSALLLSSTLPDGLFEVARLPISDPVPENLSHNPAQDINPRYHAGLDKIVFSSNREGRYHIFLMNRDGSDVEQLTSGSADYSTPSFSVDGRYVVFSSTRDGDNDLYALELETGTLTNLTNDTVDDRSPHCGEFELPE